MAQPQQQQRYRRIPIDFLLNHDEEPVVPKWQPRAMVTDKPQAYPQCPAMDMNAIMYTTSAALTVQHQLQQQKTVGFSQYSSRYTYQNQDSASPVSTSPQMPSLKQVRTTPYILSHMSSASNSEYQSQIPTPRQEEQESVEASTLENGEDRSFDSVYASKMEKKVSAGSGLQGVSKKKQATARRKWTAEEDEILRQAVKKYGLKNWKYISTLFPGRNGDRVRLRYQYYLMYPENVRHREFTPEEDELISREMDQKTHRWALLSEQFGRSAIAIKNRSHVIKRKSRPESEITILNKAEN